MSLRAKPVWAAVCVAGAMFAASGAIAAAPTRWERTNAAALRQNVIIAVCLLQEEEIVCVGVGCRKMGGYDFVEMITGDWLEGPTRLNAGGHVTTSVMRIDRRASRALNVPVSRGPIRSAFLWRLVRHENEGLRMQNSPSGYEADFPLAGFRRAHRMLRHICAADAARRRRPCGGGATTLLSMLADPPRLAVPDVRQPPQQPHPAGEPSCSTSISNMETTNVRRRPPRRDDLRQCKCAAVGYQVRSREPEVNRQWLTW